MFHSVYCMSPVRSRTCMAQFKNRINARLASSTPLAQISNFKQYLKHCKTNQVSLESTVFRGTLYEYTAKNFLEESLRCFDLIRKGGAFDNGIDLVGKWDLSHFFNLNVDGIKQSTIKDKTKVVPIIKNSKEFRQLRNLKTTKNSISMKKDISVLVQCKNHRTKIKASVIRELVGIYLHHIKTEIDTNSTFMILISPHPLTKQAQGIIDQTSIPLIHVILSPLQLSESFTGNMYSPRNWKGGLIESVYLNNYSKILLKYLDIELELQKLKLYILHA